ncbi:Ig-like domain-containing protein [Flavobacterium cerinum]|uniref:T9SS type A sorting domain-containing protein n=1 Tax=Flavobacterium cerinum TaxID=2502784 RepID=A0A3S3Q847_9FLAO|nr:T9SS type A sorting domain-containing protein [Flavobacterium cerinum]RWW98872.1 T9SS type A sorting domain-containing protein [Flavobacterium cerinum]
MKKTMVLSPFPVKRKSIKHLNTALCFFFLALGQIVSAQDYVTLGAQIQDSGNENSSPVNGFYAGRKIQIIYSAAELLAGGAAAGNIQRLAWDIIAANDAEEGFPNYTIKMGHTTVTGISGSNFITYLTQVKAPFDYMPATGFNDIIFDSPFNWNGIDNVVIDICFDNMYFSDSDTFGKLWNYNGVANSYIHSESDDIVLCNTPHADGSLAKKPRVRFFMQKPSCVAPTTFSTSVITENSVVINWGASSSNPANGYSYYKSDSSVAPLVNTSPTGTVTAGNSFTNISGLNPNTVYYVWIKSNCSTGTFSNWNGPIVFRTLCDSNDIVSTIEGARCGAGNVTLEAVSNGGTIKWYDTPTGGVALAAGNSFITPEINTNTTYYAAAEAMAGSGIIGTATTLIAAQELQPTAFCNRWSNYKAQIIYTAGELIEAGLTQGNLTSIGFNIATLGSSAVNQDYIVKMGTVTGVSFATTTFLTTGLTTVFGPQTYTHTASGWQIINFTTPYFWDGSSNIVVEISHKGVGSDDNARTYYTETTGSNTALVNNGITSKLSSLRPNIVFGSCSSPRVPVLAALSVSPVLSLSASNVIVCANEAAVVTVAEGADDYDTYVWTPSEGVSGNAASGWVFDTDVTTEYVLHASQSTGTLCSANPLTVNIVVHSLPTAIITTPEISVCPGSIQVMTAEGGVVAKQLFKDTFDIASTQFITQDFAGTSSAALNTSYAFQGTGSVLFKATSNNADVCYSMNTNINLSGYTVAQLTFSHIAALDGPVKSHDLGYVQYSSDGGTTWVTFPASSYAGEGDLVTIQGENVAVNGVIFSSKSYADWALKFIGDNSLPDDPSLWKTETINIPVAALTNDFRVRFKYTSDFSSLFYGWLIDNLKVTGIGNNLVWSPVTDLYSDEAATIPYTGEPSETVYVKSDISRSYIVTSSSSVVGCAVTAGIDVIVKEVAAPTVPAAVQVFCNSGTIAELITDYGTDIKWYASAAGGIVLASTTILEDNVIYYASQTIDNCEGVLRTPLTVHINELPPAPKGEIIQTITLNGDSVATIEDIEVILEERGTVVWYNTLNNAVNNEDPLEAYTQLIDGENYFGVQVIEACVSEEVLNVTVGIIMGRDQFNKDQFTYYPNPVNNVLNLSSITEITSVGIFNLLGQQISFDQPNALEVKVDMTSCIEGIYLIKIGAANNTVKTIKIVKK